MSAIEFFDKQNEFAEAVFSGLYSYLLYGGAIGGGKSWTVIALVLALCKIFPGSRWCIVRKDLPTLRRNTIPTFNKIAPRPFVGSIHQGTWSARCTNGSEIVFLAESFKEDPELNRFKGLEVNGFVLEEANELQEQTFNMCIQRAGRWKAACETQPLPYILLTCNPSKEWPKRLFYDPKKLGLLQAPFYYLPATADDNPHHTPEYRASLETLKDTDPAGYERFVKGNWESADDPRQLIPYDWVIAARNVEAKPGILSLGVDVARYGDDDTVFAHRNGNTLSKIERFHGLSTTDTAKQTQARINDQALDPAEVKVDAVGIGAGVVDTLKAEGFSVAEVQSGGKAVERPDSSYKFFNLRSQMWWDLREKLRKGEVSIAVDETKLTQDLTAPKYDVDGEKVIKVESKDQIKKRLGRSTDAGDAVVYAFAELDNKFVTDFELPADGVQQSYLAALSNRPTDFGWQPSHWKV